MSKLPSHVGVTAHVYRDRSRWAYRIGKDPQQGLRTESDDLLTAVEELYAMETEADLIIGHNGDCASPAVLEYWGPEDSREISSERNCELIPTP